jgi:hypothetical protein
MQWPPAESEATMNPSITNHSSTFVLRFQSLFHEGRALAFPCDAAGDVDLNRLSERARDNYRRALQAVGRDFALPAVEPAVLH